MILGVGVDIIEIERVERALTRRPRLKERLFVEPEIAYCENRPASCYSHFAGRFAAKEAVAKALGVSLSWHDVVIDREPGGKPVVRLFGRACTAAGDAEIMLTISHSRDFAVAYAVLARKDAP
jgi:holo-[acyl-carrier protein] synthase